MPTTAIRSNGRLSGGSTLPAQSLLRAVLLVPLLCAAQASVAQDSIEMRIAIYDLVADSRFDEAAELVLRGVRAQFGDPSRELARAQMTLADTFRTQGDFDLAESWLVDATTTLRGIESGDPTLMIDALLKQGDLYQLQNEHAYALEAYREARDLGRRSMGLLNLQQLDIIERMSVSYLAEGNEDYAKAVQEEAWSIRLRHFGVSSAEALEAHYSYARWLRNHANLGIVSSSELQLLYLDARNLIHENFAESEPEMAVRMLRELAHEVLTGMPYVGINNVAIYALLNARDLYEKNELDDPQLLAIIQRDMGDWSVLFAFLAPRVEDAYQESWEVLGTLPDGPALRTSWFSPLTVLYAAPAKSRRLTADPDAPWGSVDLAFTVDEDGRARDIEVVWSDPPGRLDTAVIRSVAESRFRPRIADGKLIRSSARLRLEFRYDP